MGNSKSKPQLNEENEQMEEGEVVKDPKHPLNELATALAKTTLDQGSHYSLSGIKSHLNLIEAAPIQAKVGINSIPYTVMTVIFDELSLCSQTCLGVTCQRFHDILKEEHPEPISLFYPQEDRAAISIPFKVPDNLSYRVLDEERLGIYWQDWSGFANSHTLIEIDRDCGVWIFANNKVYGHYRRSKNRKEDQKAAERRAALKRRYSDYYLSQQQVQSYGNRFRSNFGIDPLTLPCPLNKGDSWDEEVLALAEASLPEPEHHTGWMGYWSKFDIWTESRKELHRIMKKGRKRSERLAKSSR
jgi:hypothetical protein